MTQPLIQIGGHPDDFAGTQRTDAWWIGPALTAAGLTLFFGYLTFRAFQGTHYWYEPYISPVAAPPVFTPVSGYPGAVPVDHAWLGAFPAWWPAFLPQSPAFFIPGLAMAFRFTCYYYRKAYYRAFAMSPPGCAVRGGHRQYRGETAILIFQNLHRYALYGAIFLLVCLWVEAIAAFFKQGELGIGVGSLVMVMNAVLLSGYTFGCHSFRHLIGGRSDCMTCDRAPTMKFKLWNFSTWFNGRHMLFAWLSLVWVVFTDVYVSMCSSGAITDLNTWG